MKSELTKNLEFATKNFDELLRKIEEFKDIHWMDFGPHNNSIQLIIFQSGDENLISRVFSITKNLNLSHQLLISNNSNLNVVLALLHNKRLSVA
jgi:hypothetical protein